MRNSFSSSINCHGNKGYYNLVSGDLGLLSSLLETLTKMDRSDKKTMMKLMRNESQTYSLRFRDKNDVNKTRKVICY